MGRISSEKKSEYNKRWREKNPEYKRQWRQENPDKVAKYSREWREKNPEYSREWREKNPEKAREHKRQWSKENPEYKRQWREKNGDRIREYMRQWKYSLTPAQYQHLLEKQSFKCASCGVDFATLPAGAISVDHCHKTNKVRGILCRSCNLALGLMNDDLVKIRKLAKYIAKFG